MRGPMLTIGKFTFEDEPINKGLIGGKIIATDTETGTTISKIYKKLHTGKTTKMEVLAQLMYELAPPKTSDDNAEDKVET